MGIISKKSTLSAILSKTELQNKSDLLINEMLSHQSGLLPWIPFYKETIDSITRFPLSDFYSKKKTINFPLL